MDDEAKTYCSIISGLSGVKLNTVIGVMAALSPNTNGSATLLIVNVCAGHGSKVMTWMTSRCHATIL